MLDELGREVYERVTSESFAEVPDSEIDEDELFPSGRSLSFKHNSTQVDIGIYDGRLEYAMVNMSPKVDEYKEVREDLKSGGLDPTVINAEESLVSVSGGVDLDQSSPQDIPESLDELYNTVSQM